MKYYIELTVRHKDPMTHYISEDFIDLSCPWVDIEPALMSNERMKNLQAKELLCDEYWAHFDPSTPAPRRWYEGDSERDENNESYTLLVYPVDGNEEDTDRIDWDTIVAGASMDAWDIWQERIDTFKDCVYDYVFNNKDELFGEDGDISYELTDIGFCEETGELCGYIEFPGDKHTYMVVDWRNSGTIELSYVDTKS
mgnify:CR=1 FL=1